MPIDLNMLSVKLKRYRGEAGFSVAPTRRTRPRVCAQAMIRPSVVADQSSKLVWRPRQRHDLRTGLRIVLRLHGELGPPLGGFGVMVGAGVIRVPGVVEFD